MTTCDPMDCNQLVQLVTAYLEGAMDVETRARFDMHMLECPPCGDYVEQFRSTIDTLRRMSDDDLDPAFRARLLAAFRDVQ
jgi:anti-sigma factor RsiW